MRALRSLGVTQAVVKRGLLAEIHIWCKDNFTLTYNWESAALHYACMRERVKHAHGVTHGRSLLGNTDTLKWRRTPHLFAFHLAHYQNGYLSVAVSRPHAWVMPTNYPFHCQRKERRGVTVFKQVLSAGPGLLRRTRHRQPAVWDRKRYFWGCELCLVIMEREPSLINSYQTLTSVYEWDKWQEAKWAVWLYNRVLITPQEFSFFPGSWDLPWLVDHHEVWNQINVSAAFFFLCEWCC